MPTSSDVQLVFSSDENKSSTLNVLSATRLNVVTGPSGSGKTRLIVGRLAQTISRRMQLLRVLSGKAQFSDTAELIELEQHYVSQTAPLILLDKLPRITSNTTVADLLSRILQLDSRPSTAACPHCNAVLVSSTDSRLIADGLIRHHGDQPCSLAVFNAAGLQHGVSHILVGEKELSVDDPEDPVPAELLSGAVFQIVDRFKLNSINQLRLTRVLQNSTILKLLIDGTVVTLAPDFKFICLPCLKTYVGTESAFYAQLSLQDWLASSKCSQLNISKDLLQYVTSLIEQLELLELRLSERLNFLSRPIQLRLFYLQTLSARYNNRLIVVDSPWLPGFEYNHVAESLFLKELKKSNNLVVACMTYSKHVSGDLNIIALGTYSQSASTWVDEDRIVVKADLGNLQGLSQIQEQVYLEQFNCKRLIRIDLDSELRRAEARTLLGTGDLTNLIADLFEKLPRARELGLDSSELKRCLRNTEIGFPADQLTFNKLTLRQLPGTTIQQALQNFIHIPKIARPLKLLDAIGLGHILLGQKLNTLSHGELRRFRLARAVLKAPRQSMLACEYPCLYLDQEQAKVLMQEVCKVLSEQASRLLIIAD